jgi:NitT/TauT family transport system substrate-binding protein
MEALHYAVGHKDEVVKVTQEVTGMKPSDPRPAFMFDLAMKQKAIGVDLPIPMDKISWLQDELLSLGKIKKKVDLDKLVDTRAREAALKLVKKTK